MTQSNRIHAYLGSFEEVVRESSAHLERGFTCLCESAAAKPMIFPIERYSGYS